MSSRPSAPLLPRPSDKPAVSPMVFLNTAAGEPLIFFATVLFLYVLFLFRRRLLNGAMAVMTLTKPQGPTGDFKGDINVTNDPPSKADLEKVADHPVLDADGKPHKFKSLYTSNPNVKQTLIIFIRHFFCGNCQEYLRSLSTSITPSTLSSLDVPTQIVIIGCGQPELIPMYIKETECSFPIYSDPTKVLYQKLGMTRTLSLGERHPEYMQYSLPSAIVRAFYQSLKSGRNMLRGGDYWQVGGEFLFEREGQGERERDIVTWCHRMRNTRDHAEIPTVRNVLGLDGAKPPLRKTFSSGIRRSSSQLSRRLNEKRLSWNRSWERSEKPSPEGSMMEKVKEEQ
ncbi:MAG: hypothetical protein LQ342_002052 [Letrouitia transgressa]|nr:MAG: hypothetical protein LQ342_002052 [Letrouitia transgressa]